MAVPNVLPLHQVDHKSYKNASSGDHECQHGKMYANPSSVIELFHSAMKGEQCVHLKLLITKSFKSFKLSNSSSGDHELHIVHTFMAMHPEPLRYFVKNQIADQQST